MRIARAWLRLEVRQRARAFIALALLTALATGTIMAAVAGARRGDSVLERFKKSTLPATAAILPNTPGFDWAPIRALPEIEAFANFGITLQIEGLPGADVEAADDEAVMNTIEKPIVFKGRMFDRSRDDEAVMTPAFASTQHKKVGDTVTVDLPSAAEFRAGGGSGPDGAFTGPKLPIHIVGIAASPWFSDEPGGSGDLILSQGVVTRYPANTIGSTNPNHVFFGNALVRLRGGDATIQRLRDDVARVTGRDDIDVWSIDDQINAPAQREVTFESRCLLAFAGAALLASFFLVGQTVARYAAASAAELETVRALGMTRRQATVSAAVGPTLVAAVGAVLGVAVAYLASQWFPIGTAAGSEPSPGRDADWLVFGFGVGVTVLALGFGAAVASWRASSARAQPAVATSAVVRAASRTGVPVALVLGARFALERGRGKTSIPVRPALIGAVTGVLGILAAMTISVGVSDAVSHPERFGQTFDVSAYLGDAGHDIGPTGALLAALRADDAVQAVDDARIAVASGPGGKGSVSLYSYSLGPKPLPVIMTAGRMPAAADEVVLAPQSLQVLGARVGGHVTLLGSKGTATLLVTGSGFVPVGYHNGYADGGWVTDAGYDTLFTGYKFHTNYVALRSGESSDAAGASLTAAIGRTNPKLTRFAFAPPATLIQSYELRQIRRLPLLLGLFLALLAVGAVGHALAIAVRRRSRDLAVLRSMGMTRSQCRGVVLTQSLVLAGVGLVFGVPLGLAVGRTVWREVTSYTPIRYVSPLPVTALSVLLPAAFVLAAALAGWPGRRAARLRVAEVLRTE